MKRYGMMIQVKPDKVGEYKSLHAAVWQDVLAILSKYNIKNYSIFWRDNLLFGYLEYHGNDYENDMKNIAADPITQKWWQLTTPCQEPLVNRQEGEWWSIMEEVFHLE